MCGRYLLNSDSDDLELQALINEVKDEKLFKELKFGEIFPANHALVLTSSGGEIMRWGYPYGEKSSLIINARNETVTFKPTFKKDIIERRCLVVANGYYEWNDRRYFIKSSEDSLIYFGACYQIGNGGSKNFVIVTKDANSSIAKIHHRMPVILTKSTKDLWLKGDFQIKLVDPDLVFE